MDIVLGQFAAAHPRDLIARHADLQVKELEFSSFAGDPLRGAFRGWDVAAVATVAGVFTIGIARVTRVVI